MQIVTAAIIKRRGRYLVAKRRTGGVVGGKWEFPGGKVEENENMQESLIRELDEELSIKADIGRFFDKHVHRYKNRSMKVFSYEIKGFSGEIKLNEHEEIRWVRTVELKGMDFTGNDKPIVAKITQALKTKH